MESLDPNILPYVIFGGMALGALGIGGWVVNTWLRIKNGYPIDGAWGQALHPKVTTQERERISLLTQENAQLRAQLGSVTDRLETIERIVTDKSLRLSAEIDSLEDKRAN
ncbi:hypothetical protein KCG44_05485 [Pacificimonas sp. WHA3]|uniref:Uncharacterized protein n=1 Tax=Pacificimonas pallii TaxID=2827236 RepID=A0ABS6SCX6_9SPHN|nr:hypothetical protein [Pacificimonas pallii]MBV7256234.1 hypothetical protein [Pacificimonas pallii]